MVLSRPLRCPQKMYKSVLKRAKIPPPLRYFGMRGLVDCWQHVFCCGLRGMKGLVDHWQRVLLWSAVTLVVDGPLLFFRRSRGVVTRHARGRRGRQRRRQRQSRWVEWQKIRSSGPSPWTEGMVYTYVTFVAMTPIRRGMMQGCDTHEWRWPVPLPQFSPPPNFGSEVFQRLRACAPWV